MINIPSTEEPSAYNERHRSIHAGIDLSLEWTREPAMGEPLKAQQDPLHAVQFYRDEDSLCRLVAQFVSDGLPTFSQIVPNWKS